MGDFVLTDVQATRMSQVRKVDASLRKIPIVVLTTSRADEDLARSYDLEANSCITRPVTFGEQVEALPALGTYWFEIVELPPEIVQAPVSTAGYPACDRR